MHEFVIDLRSVKHFAEFVEAINKGMVRHLGGEWLGQSFDALNDYLSWCGDGSAHVLIRGWRVCRGLTASQRAILAETWQSHDHVVIDDD